MSSVARESKTLIQAIGNPLKSDDAVGPILIERLGNQFSLNPRIDLEWVYQLQLEHAEQWGRYQNVILVDADASATEPVTWREITPSGDTVAAEVFNSHILSPNSIYLLMKQFFQTEKTTRVFVLGIQAEKFDLGETLSLKSQKAVCDAEKCIQEKLSKLAP